MRPKSDTTGKAPGRSRRRQPWSYSLVLVFLLVLTLERKEGQAQTNQALPPKPKAAGRMSWETIRSRWAGVPLSQLRASAEQGDSSAQCYLGWAYENGRGISSNREQAESWCRKAAAQGLAQAQFFMGVMAENQRELQGNTVVGNYPVAAEWFQQAAEQGHPEAMLHLGDLYYYGKLPRSHVEAAKWFRRAAESGNEKAVRRLGELYQYNRGDLPEDHAESARWYRIAAEKGDPEAQYQLGCLLLEGHGLAHDLAAAKSWLSKAAAAGQSEAAIKLATLAANSSQAGLSALSREQLEDAAARTDSQAAFLLGIAWEEGRGGPTNSYRAAGLYWRIVDYPSSGNQEGAMQRLIGLYALGRVQPIKPKRPGDLEDAGGWPNYYFDSAPASPEELARRLAQHKDLVRSPQAQFQFGEMFYHGEALPENWEQAVEWWRRAAQAGSAEALNRLGELWAAGVNGQPDFKEAVRWYRRAALKGLPLAQVNLGRAYLKGEGLEPDTVEAWAWLRLAADHNLPAARQELSRLEPTLTPEQLKSAKARAAEYQRRATSQP